MSGFDFEAVKSEIYSSLPNRKIHDFSFYETFSKGGIPHLLVLTDARVPASERLFRADVFIRYYTKNSQILSFIGQFFRFISEGLQFAYMDDWKNIHIFVSDEFMYRAYGFKHNNIKALKEFLDLDVHVYPASDSYRQQIRQAAINRLILAQNSVIGISMESIFQSQRGIFTSTQEIESLDLDFEENNFHKSYDFDQAMSSYIIGLSSAYVIKLAADLEADPNKKFTRIIEYTASLMKINIDVYHRRHGYNLGEWETVDISLPDGEASIKFYEKPSIKKWNKVVIEKSDSALSRIVIPYFLNSLRMALSLKKDSQYYLSKYK